MRTTVDLPDDLHAVALSIARDTGSTLSQTIARLLRSAIEPAGQVRLTTSSLTGLPVVSLGGPPVTADDVRRLDDEE